MKTRILITMMLLAVTSFVSMAGSENANNTSTKESLKKFIDTKIGFPQFLKQQEQVAEQATILFTLTEEGRISIIEVKADNYELKKYIFQTLEGAKYENIEKSISKDTYKVQLKFKLI